MNSTEKRLAVYLPSLRGGGAEQSMLRLAEGIARRGCAVDLVLAQKEGPYLAGISQTVRVVDLKASRALNSVPGLTRYLRRERPDALLSVLDYTNVLSLWAHRLAGVPTRTVVNEQNTISNSSKNSAQRRQQVMPWFVKHFYPWANIIIGNSEGVIDDLMQVTGLPRNRLSLIYNPVVTPELIARVEEPLDHPWFEPGELPVVLAVGRLTVQKDFPTLLQAFARVRQNSPARLLILGEGPDRPKLEALIKELHLTACVSLPGFIDNPYIYMKKAALFVLSSRWEGLPTVLIEALFCGAPIVATNCPSGPREILQDGRYGRLVSVGSVTELAQEIEAGLSGKIQSPPEKSWRPFELEPIVDKYIDVLMSS